MVGIGATSAPIPPQLKAAFEHYVRTERWGHPYARARIVYVLRLSNYAWLRWVTPEIDGTALYERSGAQWRPVPHAFSAGYDPRQSHIPISVPPAIAFRLATDMPPLHNATPRSGDACLNAPEWLGTSNIGRPYNTAASSVVNIVGYVATEDNGTLLPVGWAYKMFDGRWWYDRPTDRNMKRASLAEIKARFNRPGITPWHCFKHELPRSYFYPHGRGKNDRAFSST